MKYDKDYFKEMPNSVAFVLGMSMAGQPVGLEMYEKAIKEGGEKYFPEEVRYRRIWASIPQEKKDQYYAEPLAGIFGNFIDEDMPDTLKNWPGIIAATNEDWKIRNDYYNSPSYKAKWAQHAQEKADLYNKYFSKYGLTKNITDFL